MNEIKQASIYLRVIWLNDNENLRPDNLNIKLDGETTENVVFSISQNDNDIGNNSPWENVTEWANGITYNYQKEEQEIVDETEERIEVSNIPYVIPSVTNIPTNYRCNILKNAETEEYSYYTIKMTYVPTKRKLMARNTTPSLVVNGTQVENVNFNGVELDKVVYNGITIFEKQLGKLLKDAILANSTLNEGTPDFSLTATTDEGMFETDDSIYATTDNLNPKSYYFRGAVTNNYVKFANFWWRIIRINGDGTIRMIYDGTSGHANGEETKDSLAIISQSYNTSIDRSEYVGYTYTSGSQRPSSTTSGTSSNAKTQLENWYNSNLVSYADKIADGKFCNDRNVASGYTWSSQPTSGFYYAGYDRSGTKSSSSVTPTLSCTSTDVYTLKVGLITMDEVVYAGSKNLTNNEYYYLYNNNAFWLMTPCEWHYNSTSSRYAKVFALFVGGSLYNARVNNLYGLRPVINLVADVQVIGTGTINDPYVIL